MRAHGGIPEAKEEILYTGREVREVTKGKIIFCQEF
jgi:hypothetical protein